VVTGPPIRRASACLKIMQFVYVLRSEIDDQLYVGCTQDYLIRVSQHNHGQVPATKNRRPLKLIYLEGYPTKEEAFTREKFYKSGRGREILKKVLFITLNKKEAKLAKVVTAHV
jgi:putative endonuclease